MRSTYGIARRWALATATTALLGCPGSLDSRFFDSSAPGTTACSSDDLQRLVFNASCTSAGCHDSSNQPSGGLDLLSAGAEQRLVGVGTPAGQTCSSSTTSVLVRPGDPAHSLLLLKVEPSPPCGSRMPFGAATALTDTQIECIRSWIASLPGGMPFDSGVPTMDAAMDASRDVQSTDVVRSDVAMDDVAQPDDASPDVVTAPDAATPDEPVDETASSDTSPPDDAGGMDAGGDP